MSTSKNVNSPRGACCVPVSTPEGEKIHSFGNNHSQQLPMIPIADGECDIPIGVAVWTTMIISL